MSNQRFDIAIVGGGFSGVCTAYHLLRRASEGVKIAIFEPRPSLGAGVAYGTPSRDHVLNVRARDMSLDSDVPDSFTRWLELEPEYGPLSFAPRMLYRQYLEDQLEKARCASQASLEVIHQEVVGTTRQSDGVFEVTCSDGTTFQAGAVVLALGNLPADVLLAGNELLTSPWDREALARAAQWQQVGILGASLTAIDVIRALESAGYQGRYHLFSRHGKWPQPHLSKPVEPSLLAQKGALEVSQQQSVLTAVRKFRAHIKAGIPWQELMDALRPHVQSLWRGLGFAEKRRFLRHLRVFWETHRQRIPEECLVMLRELQDSGRLTLRAGWASQVRRGAEGGVEITTGSRLAPSQVTHCDVAFNCLGWCFDLRFLKSPLLAQLMADGLASLDEMNFALQCTPEGQLRDQPGLFTLGPLRRGELWETVAVQEIRSQAQTLARTLI